MLLPMPYIRITCRVTPSRSLLCPLALVVALAAACGKGEAPTPRGDGGLAEDCSDGSARLDLVGGDDGSWVGVDFVISGCTIDPAGRCRGVAPLTLRFAAVTTVPVEQGLWRFGDGDEAEGLAAEHTYQLPGTYAVAFSVGYGGGTVSARKEGFVVVEGAAPGARCESSKQCGVGSCVCPDGGCPGLLGGMCWLDCGASPCPEGSHCVQLVRAGSAPWQGTSCQQRCAVDIDCDRPDFACRWLPSGGSVRGWLRACAPRSLLRFGAACRGAGGAVDDQACAAGRCLGLGVRGYCSADCDPGQCPEPLRCAAFGGGVASDRSGVCVVPCVPGSCSDDPSLACRSSGGAGSLDFEILGAPDAPDAMYCSAKPCRVAADCGLLGACSQAGYCGG